MDKIKPFEQKVEDLIDKVHEINSVQRAETIELNKKIEEIMFETKTDTEAVEASIAELKKVDTEAEAGLDKLILDDSEDLAKEEEESE